jgi:ATP-dependent helicase HrpA
MEDVLSQLDTLSDPEITASVGTARSADLLRYLAAAERRIDALPGDLRRDQERQAIITRIMERYALWRIRRGETLWSSPVSEEELDPRWMIEELRVSLWAQNLGTGMAVSEARLLRVLEDR